MATTSHSVFDDANIPPMASIGPGVAPRLPHRHPQDRVASDDEARIDAGGLRAQARKAKGNWQPSSEQQRSVVLTGKWKAANRSIVEACRTLARANRSHTPAALELLACGPSFVVDRLGEPIART